MIVYPVQRGRPTDVQRQTNRAVDYLVNSRGINAQRIVTLVGPPEMYDSRVVAVSAGRETT